MVGRQHEEFQSLCESFGCDRGKFTECLTLALSIQDLDQKCIDLLTEINVVMLFPILHRCVE